MSLENFKKLNSVKPVSKKRYKNRNTGFKGIHVHYSKDRSEVFFRPTLKINNQEIMGYQNFSFDYFGLFIAIRFYDNQLEQYLRLNNSNIINETKYPKLIKSEKINKQIELALQHSDLFSLKILFTTLTGIKDFDFDEICNDIKNKE